MQHIKLIVFDIAGTTVKDNGEIGAAFWNALKDYGYIVSMDKILSLMGYKKPMAIRRMVEEHEENKSLITDDYINAIHERFQELMISYYREADAIEALPHVLNTFTTLKEKGITIGLDTGFSKNITDVIMQRLGWIENNVVDYVVSSDEVASGRPEPYMIQRLMQLANVTDPKQVVKVGDTEVDVQEGRYAGCLYSIAVTTGAFTRSQLKPYEPSFIIDDMSELLPLLQNQ